MHIIGNAFLVVVVFLYFLLFANATRRLPRPWTLLAAWWRRGGKKDVLSVLILIIGLIALIQLLWFLDASGLNHVSR
ncbi:hypothetical protein [Spirosoma sp.]|uniref:hypothetical protein n=1 Tax=Spirosoma sp. TaxID=1899569 RepID=UPI002612BBEA|nr:hypothetical protein [Spirosoma sp.]MCX6218311.1 hypothetical protein [Spirosoma sp.]